MLTASDITNLFFGHQGYLILDQDPGTTSYIGFENSEGKWYIQKSVAAAGDVTYTYSRGEADYSTGWAGRAALTYGTVSEIFN
jgi:CobQ-like glutamine amidotransferase family enzyme